MGGKRNIEFLNDLESTKSEISPPYLFRSEPESGAIIFPPNTSHVDRLQFFFFSNTWFNFMTHSFSRGKICVKNRTHRRTTARIFVGNKSSPFLTVKNKSKAQEPNQ